MKRALLCALLMTTAFSASGQTHPNLEKGFGAEKMYQLGDIDSVNMFNRNLVITLPLGSPSPVSDQLSVGLTLVYNSKLWEPQKDYWGPNEGNFYWSSVASKRSNAGLGWRVSLGALYDVQDTMYNATSSLLYVSPDGGEHVVRTTLHGETGTGTAGYTRDGTYIRAKEDPNDSNVVLLNFPDGTTHRFEGTLEHDDSDDENPWTLPRDYRRFRLTAVTDVHGNGYTISYATANEWRITDRYGRLIRVAFRDNPVAGGPDWYEKVIDYVEFPIFAISGQTATGRYEFAYKGALDANECNGTGTGKLPALASVQLKVGTSVLQRFEADYNVAAHGDYGCSWNAIKLLRLPTRAEINYEWGTILLPGSGCELDDPVNATLAVKTRTIHDPDGSVADAVTSYRSEFVGNDATETWDCRPDSNVVVPIPPEALITTVTDPDGDETVHYFSIWNQLRASKRSSRKVWYGYPFTPVDVPSPFSRSGLVGGKYLSTMLCSGACSTSSMLQSTYVRYETDDLGPAFGDVNQRLAGSRTTYDLAGTDRVDVDSTDFDGLGHYRVQTTEGTFPTTMKRVVTTSYNSADSVNPLALSSGTYNGSAGGGNFTLPLATVPWVLGNYTSVTTTVGTETAVRQFCFEPATGFLAATRTPAGTTPVASDLIAAFERRTSAPSDEPNGYVKREAYYGGDKTPVSSTVLSQSLCAAATGLLGGTTATYTIRHTNQYGVRKSSAYDDSTSTIPILNRTIDASTGLPVTISDSADVATTLTYDALKRTTSLSSPGFAPVTYEYTPATTTVPAKATVTQTSGTDVAAYELEFDHLGRIAEERQKMPGAGIWSTRRTVYDVSGRKHAVTEWLDAAEALGTTTHRTETLYDGLGRPLSVTAPDGAVTTFGYVGSREVTRTVSGVATPTGDRSVTTTEEYDAFGQLRRVREPAGPTTATSPVGAEVVTNYQYDVGGRLSSVVMQGAGSNGTQTRTFSYDNRGLLLYEDHPESGITGYSSYDARGHVGLKTQGSRDKASLFDLSYTYDNAERVVRIDSRNPFYVAGSNAPHEHDEFRPSKVFEFATANEVVNGVNNLAKGKLKRAIRHNWGPVRRFGGFSSGQANNDPVDSRYVVTEQYFYGDTAGRRTARTTTIEKMPDTGTTAGTALWTKVVTQSQAYDLFGNITTMNYPACDFCGTSTSRLTSLARTFDAGRLTSVPGFASSFEYWAGGEMKSFVHANNVKDSRDRDPNGMPRPRSIKFESWASCVAPKITVPPRSITIPHQTSTDLSVTATGTSLQYQWYEVTGSGATALPGQTQSVFHTPALTSEKTYFVIVRNECNVMQSLSVVVSVTAAPPVIEVQPQAEDIIAPGQTRRLTVVARGSGTLSYAWFQGPSGSTGVPVGSNLSYFDTPPLLQSTQYWVRVTSSGQTADSASGMLFVQPSTPSTLTATRSGSTISVQWTAAVGAGSYMLERADGGAFVTIYTGTSTTFNDSNVMTGKTYAYRAKALADTLQTPLVLYSGATSAAVESMRTFTPVVAGQVIDDAHFHDLLAGLNALRATRGAPEVTWPSILPPGTPVPAGGASIRAIHLMTIFARIDEALAALGAPAAVLVDPPVPGGPIRASQINTAQERMR